MSTPVGPKPCNIACPSCGQQIQTKISYTSTTKTHAMALLLCLFFCWPCVCIPYCSSWCRNADHYCPKCDAYIGTYS